MRVHKRVCGINCLIFPLLTNLIIVGYPGCKILINQLAIIPIFIISSNMKFLRRLFILIMLCSGRMVNRSFAQDLLKANNLSQGINVDKLTDEEILKYTANN